MVGSLAFMLVWVFSTAHYTLNVWPTNEECWTRHTHNDSRQVQKWFCWLVTTIAEEHCSKR
jgi:hypothetical protein